MTFRALITGVSGFVGGHLAEHLLAAGDAVLGLSPDGGWSEASPPHLQGRIEVLAWNLGESGQSPDRLLERLASFAPQVVYHLAAMSVPQECGEGAPTPRAVAVNVDGTRRVLQLARRLPGRPRVLVASSNHVYAPVGRQSPRVDEDAPLGPRTAYGRTKLAAEEVVHQAVAEWECNAVVARPFQHTGPGQAAHTMLPSWTRQFVEGGNGPIEVYTRDALLDLSDVRDVVRAYRLLARHAESGATYNIGSGIAQRSGDVLERLRRLCGSQRQIVEISPGEKQEPIADTTRLTRLTGWQPAIALDQTIADTLAWWRRRAERP